MNEVKVEIGNLQIGKCGTESRFNIRRVVVVVPDLGSDPNASRLTLPREKRVFKATTTAGSFP
jgi:hypothetical protein